MKMSIAVIVVILLVVAIFLYLNSQAPEETPSNITGSVANVTLPNATKTNVTEQLPTPPS